MKMPSKCIYCGEDAVIEDSDGSMLMMVCQECGSINKDTSLVTEGEGAFCFSTSNSEREYNFKQSLSKHARQAFSKNVPLGLKSGKERVKTVGQTFKLNSLMMEDADKLFEQVFHQPEILHKTINNKLTLAISCIYIILRQNNSPISIREFCRVSHTSIEDFSVAFRLILKLMKIKLTYPCIGSSTVQVLSSTNLKLEIHQVTQEVLQICEKTWLVSGREHTNIIIAASYIALLGVEQKDISLRKYCKDVGLKFTIATAARCREIEETITELGKSLPWVRSDFVDKKLFIRKYLKEILKYHKSLLHCHAPGDDILSELEQNTEDNSLSVSHLNGVSNPITKTSAKEQGITHNLSSANGVIKEEIQSSSHFDPNTNKYDTVKVRENITHPNLDKPSPLCDLKTAIEIKASKNINIPPSFNRPRKRRADDTGNMGDYKLGDNDELTEAQEKDVNQYIRSKEEIHNIENFTKCRKETK